MSSAVQDCASLEQASVRPDAAILGLSEAANLPESVPGDEASPALDLTEIATRIKGRDAASASYSRQVAIDNGLDLLRAKPMVGHGQFGPWCRDHLSYSKSKAERLMRLARAFGPDAESVGCTDLPPLDLLHALLAPSTPAHVRDAFLTRINRGDNVAAELRDALKAHREDRAHQNRMGEAEAPREHAEVGNEPAGDDAREQHAEAYTRALEFLGECLASHLEELMALLDAAGPGRVLTPEATRALADLARSPAAAGATEKGGDSVSRQVIIGRPTFSGGQRPRVAVQPYPPLKL